MLDEPTSAVDNETEAAIQRPLRTATAGCAAIVVAHRLSTMRHADRIWVMDAGRIMESGTHDELITRGGAYAGMWHVQTGSTEGATDDLPPVTTRSTWTAWRTITAFGLVSLAGDIPRRHRRSG